MKNSFLKLLPQITATIIVVGLLLPSVALALTAQQRSLFNSGLYWYNSSPDSGFCGNGSGALTSIEPGSVYMLGDSITEGAEDYLRSKFADSWSFGEKDTATDRINGKQSRSIVSAVSEINKDSALIANSTAIIIALGTNDGASDFSSYIKEVLLAVRKYNSSVPVFWVDVAVTSYDSTPGNTAIYSGSATEDYVVIPWFKTVFPNSNPTSTTSPVDTNGYLLGDGTHPSETGYTQYADLVFRTVSQLQVVSNIDSLGVINIAGSNDAEKAYNYFRSRGLSGMQSAAVLGNLYIESRLNPAMKEGGKTFSSITEINPSAGFGLAQWTHPKRQERWKVFTVERGLDIVKLESQLEWIWEEWPSFSDYGQDEFFQSTNLRQATWVFLSYYEGPGSIEGHRQTTVQPTTGTALNSLNVREQAAREFMEQFGENAVQNIDSQNLCLFGTNNADFSATGVKIDGSPEWIGKPGNCEPTFTPGASSLKTFVLEVWQPPVGSVGGYNCRSIRGNDSLTSIHGMGRALDIYVDANNPAELAIGDEIRNWMIANSVDVGVQRVIWNRYSWNSEKDGWTDYCQNKCADEGGGRSPHTDHVHVEINEDGANKVLNWYVGR